MRRTVLCLLIAFASAAVAARESKLSAADDAQCPGHSVRQSSERVATRDDVAPTMPAPNKTKVTPRGGDSDGPAGRIPSPRWHRFLPGMFR